jgi:hypothetical protein
MVLNFILLYGDVREEQEFETVFVILFPLSGIPILKEVFLFGVELCMLRE